MPNSILGKSNVKSVAECLPFENCHASNSGKHCHIIAVSCL